MLIFQTICSPWNNTQKERKKRGWFFFGMKRNENDIAIIGPTASLYEKNVWAIEWGRNRGKERDSTIDGESVLNVFFFCFLLLFIIHLQMLESTTTFNNNKCKLNTQLKCQCISDTGIALTFVPVYRLLCS